MNYVPGSSVMPFNEESRASRITASIGHTVDSALESSTSSIFEIFFLIYDELGRCIPPNSILVFIQIIISFYQYYIATFFPFLPGKWDFNVFPDKVLRYLTYPNDLGLGNEDILHQGIPCYFINIFDALLFFYFLWNLIYYHMYKMFPKYNVYITRFILTLIIPIILPPTCYNIGFSFNSIFEDRYFDIEFSNSTNINDTSDFDIVLPQVDNKYRSAYIASTFFSIFLFLILLFIFYIDIMFRSSTPYLENTPLSMWDGFPIFLSIFGSCVVNLSTRLINRFPNWSGYFLIICTIFYNSYILFKMLSLPMIKQWMNIFISLFVSAGIFASLFQLFPISSLYRLIIPLVILAALIPALIFLHRFLKKKVMQIDITKDHITKEYQALRYIRIHVAFKSEEFVSFKFTKQMNHINTNKIISQVAQVISFFPSESQNLTFYISLLTKNSTLSFHQRFLLFQLRQVHVLRQSNTSKQLNEDLADIAKVTNRAINSFQQFLIRMIDERQALTIDSLRILAKINRNTNTICHEGMARYPNNSRLLFIFSRYLIECQTDFKEGVFFYHEGLMIERGKRAIIDLAFQSMVNLFPVYLWKKILNYKGQNILHRKHSKSGSSMSVDSVTNGRSNKISESDFESNEKVASNVMENPKLRFALRKSVNNMHSTGISMLTFSTIFRFLCSFIICVVMLYVAPEFLRTRSNNFKTISQINVFRKTLDLCLFRTAKLWSFNLNLAPKEDNISTFLGSTITLKDYNNLTYDPYFELFTNVIHSINASEELGKLLIEIKYKSFANLFDKSGEIGNKSQTDLLHVKNISFCNNRRHKIYQSTTSLRYFSLYILNQVVRVSTLNKIIRIQLTGSILKVFVKLF